MTERKRTRQRHRLGQQKHREIKEQLLRERGRQCEYCGEPERSVVRYVKKDRKRYRSNLEIHHLNNQRRDNRPDNLILLCKCCHEALHINGPFWYVV